MADQTLAPPPGFAPIQPQSGDAPAPPPGFTPIQQQQPPQQQPSGFDPNTSGYDFNPRHLLEVGKGVIKGGMNTAAGLMENYAQLPASGAGPGLTTLAQKIRQHAVLHNKDQEAGNVLETVAELLTPAGVEGAGEEAAAHAGQIAEGAQTVAPKASQLLTKALARAKAFEADPELHALTKIGLKTLKGGASAAARGAVEQGAQTAIKSGGDPEATAEAAQTGAIAGGATGGVLSGGAEGVSQVAQDIESMRPGTTQMLGTKFQTLKDKLLLRNLGRVTQDPATQSVDEAGTHLGKTMVANSINRTNGMMPEAAQPLPESRQLPGGGGFSMQGEPTTEIHEGDIVQPARKKQIGTRVVEGKGPGQFDLGQYESGQPTPREAATPPETRTIYHKEPIFQYQNEARPGGTPRHDVITGPGTITAMSEAQARTRMGQYQRILNDDAQMEQLPQYQQEQIRQAHADLADQLGRVDDFHATQPHFPPGDPVDMVRHTNSYQDGVDQLKGHYGRFFTQADNASGGQFTELRNAERSLRARIWNPETPPANDAALKDALAQNLRDQDSWFQKYRTTATPEEWDAHRTGYQDALVNENLNDFLQAKFNGISRAEEARGAGQRVFQPSKNFNQQLEDLYNEGNNREVLERTIGQQHMDELKTMGQLFERADRRADTNGLINNITAAIRHHYHGMKGVLAAGGGGGVYALTHSVMGAAGIAGAPLVTGTAAGIRNAVQDELISNPEFLKQFNYSVMQRLPKARAGSMLAARIVASYPNLRLQNSEQQQAPQQQHLSESNDELGTRLTAQALRESPASAVQLQGSENAPLSPDLEDRVKNPKGTKAPLTDRVKQILGQYELKRPADRSFYNPERDASRQ